MNAPDRQPSVLRPNLERRRKPRGTTQRAVSGARRFLAWFSRTAQVIAGLVVAAPGIAALYVVGRRIVADHAVTMMDWAFFTLGALMMGAGLGIAIGARFWTSLGKMAALADDVWDSVRGKDEAGGARG